MLPPRALLGAVLASAAASWSCHVSTVGRVSWPACLPVFKGDAQQLLAATRDAAAANIAAARPAALRVACLQRRRR